jgi:hypothetical protein
MMSQRNEKLIDGPQVFFRRHPTDCIKSAQVQGTRIPAQSLLALEVVIVLKVGHDEFTDGTVDWFTETQTGVIGFCNGAPVPALLINGKNVIVIPDGFKIND